MNFKEALIAHLQGEKVEVYSLFPAYDKPSDGNRTWRSFGEYFKGLELGNVDDYCEEGMKEFRLAPRKILVNGVEVPAPEMVDPEVGTRYYLPHPSKGSRYASEVWVVAEFDVCALEDGLVYLDKESAIARAKAMLITQEAV